MVFLAEMEPYVVSKPMSRHAPYAAAEFYRLLNFIDIFSPIFSVKLSRIRPEDELPPNIQAFDRLQQNNVQL